MNTGRLNNLSLKYHSFTLSSCRDIGFRKSEFVTKTQFHYNSNYCKEVFNVLWNNGIIIKTLIYLKFQLIMLLMLCCPQVTEF